MKKVFVIFSMVLLLASFSSCKQETTKSERPNIIFIMSDDHAYQAILAYSNHLIETPNIDRIDTMGMLFTNATVTNSICAPSRATILTGKLSHLNGKVDNHFPFDTTNVTFPQLFRKRATKQPCLESCILSTVPKGLISLKFFRIRGNIQSELYHQK